MSDIQILFSYKGRMGRGPFVLAQICVTVMLVVFQSVFLRLTEVLITSVPDVAKHSVAVGAIILFWILTFLIWLPTTVKRFHDMGYSGWWVLLALIPIFNLIAIIRLFFFKGTIGPNKYGVDPSQFTATSL